MFFYCLALELIYKDPPMQNVTMSYIKVVFNQFYSDFLLLCGAEKKINYTTEASASPMCVWVFVWVCESLWMCYMSVGVCVWG